MTRAGRPPQFTEEDFKKWLQWSKAGMEIDFIAERVGASYGFVQRKIKELRDEETAK